MGGERLKAATLTARGIVGDRGWAVFDESRQGITNAKRLPLLRACRPRYVSEPSAETSSPPVEITWPDNSRARTDTPDAARQLSDLLGRPVSFRALDGTDNAAPRITSAGDAPDAFRAMMGLHPGEPMPDLSDFPPERLRALRQGNFFDALPLHLLTDTTLKTLSLLAPESNWDERRFRPNLFVAADSPDGYPELGWIGRQLRIGGNLIEVVSGCPRCVMATQAVDELPADHRVMRTLVRATKHTAGIYARVLESGEIRVGDEISMV